MHSNICKVSFFENPHRYCFIFIFEQFFNIPFGNNVALPSICILNISKFAPEVANNGVEKKNSDQYIVQVFVSLVLDLFSSKLKITSITTYSMLEDTKSSDSFIIDI